MLKFMLVIIMLFPASHAFSEEFIAGKDYQILGSSTKIDPSKSQISVMEFFSYGCPWCYRIEPSLTAWVRKQGKLITFIRIPVVFHREWLYYAKAYYTARLLGLEDKLSLLLFKAVQDERQSLDSNQAMINFFMAQGVDKATVTSAFEYSPTIDMQISSGAALMSRLQINAVPAIVIDDRYKIDLQMAGGEARFFQVLDFIIKQLREKH